MLAFSFWEAIWLIFVSFVFITVLMMLFSVIVDLFRDQSLSGWAKAAWVVFLIILPLIGLLVYLIARGKGMTERSLKEQTEAKQSFDSYVKDVAGGRSGLRAREGQRAPLRRQAQRRRVRPTEGENSRLMRRAAALILLAVGAASGSASVVRADGPAPRQVPEAELEQQLAERFAPVIMLKEQEDDCDPHGEPYRPTAVDIVLDNPEIALRQVGGGDPVVMRAPSAADLAGLNQGFFLDFPGSSLSPGCIFETDFRKYSGDQPPAVYAHVVQQPDEPDLVFVQYWIYWYYNDWNNKHESDWEGITLKFEATSVEEALAGEPVAVGYSQHEGGERADWDADKLEREGDHPVVYSSAGSHASYFGSDVYLGRGAAEGFGCDTTTGPSERVEPVVIVLPDAVDDPDDPLAWLAFNGRWGERQTGSFNGPTGPATKSRWLEPAPWFDDLRDSSVVIPAGDTQGSSVIGVFCDVSWSGGRRR